jgi:Rrf2 family nitric oxide-sensitive transcriptional repressor
MISQTAEYALRAVVDLAYHFGQSRTTEQIAAATKVPLGYLAKILQDLAKANIVRSQRGLHGGFALNQSPERLTVYDVLLAVDPPKRIRSCPLGLAAHATRLCPLHKKLDDAMASIERTFSSCTIADVTADPGAQPLRERVQPLTISGGLAVAPVRSRRKSRR